MDWLTPLLNQQSTQNRNGLFGLQLGHLGSQVGSGNLTGLGGTFNSLGRANISQPKSNGLWGIEGLTPMNALGLGLGLFQGVSGLIGGNKELRMARDALNFQKDAFNKNFENQRKLTNASLEDRQRARVAGNPGAYMSVEEYMQKYGV